MEEVQLEAHPCLLMHGICFVAVTAPSAKSAKDCYMTETAHVDGEKQKPLLSIGPSSVGENGKSLRLGRKRRVVTQKHRDKV